MASWIKEGVAERSAARIRPVRHLLVDDNSRWALWCSGGRGVAQTPMPGNDQFCRECVALANEAIEDETLEASDIQGWPVTQ